jgi:DNA mismatch repair protein MutS2
LPHDLIETARRAIAPDQAQVESLLSDIRRERDEATAARLAEERARVAAEESRTQAETRLAEVEERLDAMVERTSAELERDAKAVRELLVQAEEAVERGRLKRAAERLEKALERRKQIEEARPAKPPKPKKAVVVGGLPPAAIQPGDLVWITGYDRFGEALSAPDERGEVELHLGPLRGRVRLEQVERVPRPKERVMGQEAGVTVGVIGPSEPPPLEIELRGQTVDEALPQIDQYLDRAYLARLPWVRIIHGRGTGTLRRQVRDLLAKHPLVRSYESGRPDEGGEGVTVVHLAE